MQRWGNERTTRFSWSTVAILANAASTSFSSTGLSARVARVGVRDAIERVQDDLLLAPGNVGAGRHGELRQRIERGRRAVLFVCVEIGMGRDEVSHGGPSV